MRVRYLMKMGFLFCVLLFSSAQADAQESMEGSREASGSNRVAILQASNWPCLWRCVEYTADHGKQKVESSVWDAQPLRLPGTLRVPSGGRADLVLKGGRTEELHLGEGFYALDEAGFASLSDGSGTFEHDDSKDVTSGEKALRGGLTAIVADPGGTHYAFIVNARGEIFIEVMDGHVQLSWPGKSSTSVTHLRGGEAVLIVADDLMTQGGLVPVEGKREIRRLRRQVKSPGVEDFGTRTANIRQVEALSDDFYAALRGGQADRAGQIALELVDVAPGSALTPRAVYLALQLCEKTGNVRKAAELGSLFLYEAALGSSPWAEFYRLQSQ